MADDFTAPFTGSGDATPKFASDSDGTRHYPWGKLAWGGDDTFTKVDTASGKPFPVQLRSSGGTELFLSTNPGFVFGGGGTAKTDVTRPADTNVYAANDTWANSTTVPTTGGFTLSNMARVSGGSGILTDLVIANSVVLPGTILQGEIWLFDQAVTAVNDNAAFTITDAEAKTLIGCIPFTMAKNGGANSIVHLQNLGIAFTCVGSADLRYLIKVLNAYTPSSGEVLSLAGKSLYVN